MRAAVLLVLLFVSGGAGAQPVRAVDGDTLAVGTERIRIMGLDAPEAGHRAPCPREAALARMATRRMAELVDVGVTIAIGGVTVQIVRDWDMQLSTHGPAGLIDRKGGGTPPILTDEHRRALATAIEDGPIPAVHGVVRWRAVDLCQWLWDGYAVRIAKQTLSRELRRIGYRRLSARPRHHAQAHGAIEAFEKVFPHVWTRSGARRASAATA